MFMSAAHVLLICQNSDTFYFIRSLIIRVQEHRHLLFIKKYKLTPLKDGVYFFFSSPHKHNTISLYPRSSCTSINVRAGIWRRQVYLYTISAVDRKLFVDTFRETSAPSIVYNTRHNNVFRLEVYILSPQDGKK